MISLISRLFHESMKNKSEMNGNWTDERQRIIDCFPAGKTYPQQTLIFIHWFVRQFSYLTQTTIRSHPFFLKLSLTNIEMNFVDLTMGHHLVWEWWTDWHQNSTNLLAFGLTINRFLLFQSLTHSFLLFHIHINLRKFRLYNIFSITSWTNKTKLYKHMSKTLDWWELCRCNYYSTKTFKYWRKIQMQQIRRCSTWIYKTWLNALY